MDETSVLERPRRYSVITAEERRLIDEAVAQGRVTRVPTGASAFERKYIWKAQGKNSMRLVQVQDGSGHKPGDVWRRQSAGDALRARARRRDRK